MQNPTKDTHKIADNQRKTVFSHHLQAIKSALKPLTYCRMAWTDLNLWPDICFTVKQKCLCHSNKSERRPTYQTKQTLLIIQIESARRVK